MSPHATAPDASRQQPARTRVAVVFGGRSSEHAISCVTAAGVMAALDPARYEVVPVGVTSTGRWLLTSPDPDRWALRDGVLPQVGDDDGVPVVLRPGTGERDLLQLVDGEALTVVAEVDVVFPLLHGPYGEDGTLQGLLDLSDTRYVGAGVLSSALSMDKHYMKAVLQAHGLPVGPYVVVLPSDWERDPASAREAVATLGYPVFVKPARAGSSMGISRVTGPELLDDAIEAARRHDPKVVVEAAVVGREVECGVLQDVDGGPPLTSLPGEIEVVAGSGHEFYDFEAKYLDGAGVRLTCPADLPDDVADAVRSAAARTYTVMACEGLARVDVFVLADGDVVVNELNTMPGFTPTSMYPRMWERSGVPYPELVDRLVQLALARRVGLR